MAKAALERAEDFVDEEEVFRRTDCVGIEVGRGGSADRGADPQGWYQRTDILSLEVEVRRSGSASGPTTEAVDLKIAVPRPATETVAALPSADFLVVTWTAAEAGAMATVFGKGSYHFDGADENNLTSLLLPNLVLPSGEKYHAHFFPATVNGKRVI